MEKQRKLQQSLSLDPLYKHFLNCLGRQTYFDVFENEAMGHLKKVNITWKSLYFHMQTIH